MKEERPIKRGRLKEWLHENSVLLNFLVFWPTVVLTAIQTYQNSVAIRYQAEQQRPRLSLGIELEPIDEPKGIRFIAPLQIDGTTVARRVMLKNYYTFDQPRLRDYISSIDVDWENREGHIIGDMSPTEEKRRLISAFLTRKQLERILSPEESLYFIARLEYCDTQDNCYYFMRCAEVGDTGVIEALVYCGTRSDRLEGQAS